MSVILAALLAAASAAPAPDLGYSQLPDPAREAQAAGLMAELRCLVCQGQSIADSDSDMAADMRRVVRTRIASGERPAEVRAWLIERYGDYVTYDPPLGWATAPLWLAPVLLLLAGAWLARGTLRRRRR
ncbi:cytochrome c-type biogenesis protein [Sphingomonas sp.]|uniref:cytochrome c-type biogenesis protein n=1 Tax=Sphingomonas sp. TaxID=28214 RepID=UPI001EBFBD0E|nr:cytochrome c-type biogenesis protein [Sphingomonas sp.]MBX3595234.1 cytochrome c-type biogenesis protein CcmH [Sphingomonas sp.]